ncbi:competence-related pilin export protein ComGB [Mesobacillus persicus]|uniref:Competence-related pilin export protein ComGB n=1 Tax=Mesobacillus persicus TaxID=930146 RepID=A0A1H7X343_9BACI|nr:competence type IV pilus assembly protein ComGB [Mesobacillus persicus]SEM28071.1 competence-related pilin export protein ComGB [Mesobacillus persicus]
MNRNAKWSVQEQASFLKRIGELLSRGYPLAEAIDSLSFYFDPKRQEEIKGCLVNLREGHPFYRILSDLNFNKDLVNYVYFAEQHGGLADAIIEGSVMVLRRNADYQRLKGLLSYPLFLIFLTILLFYFVNKALLPRFSSLYQNMDVEPTLFTKVLSTVEMYAPLFMFLFLLASVCCIIYYLVIFRKYRSLEKRERLVRLPLAGNFLKLLYSHFFTTQLSYLLSSGMSVIEALQIFERHKQSPFSAELGSEIKESLSNGQDLDKVIFAYPFFEEELGRIIRHGQENGRLDKELHFYSRHCLTLLEEKTRRGMKIIQPALYCMIGILIVALYLAILLPMFKLIQGI